jgi:hypothetical protein
VESWGLWLPGTGFNILICSVLVWQFNFGFLINDAKGGAELTTSYIYQFLFFLGVLGLV